MFYRSDKQDRHYHIVVRTADGAFLCSESKQKKHRHEVAMVDGAIVLLPAEEGGHSHALVGEVEATEVKPKRDDTETIAEVQRLFKEAKQLEADFRKAGKLAEDFYFGDQWDSADRKKLEASGRPAITINEIEPKIDLLKGYQTRNRYDIRYFPVEGGDSVVADILTALVKNITEQNNFAYEESAVFEDQLIPGRGLFDVNVSYEDNLEGEIEIDRFQWDDGFFGPHEKMDASDAEYQVKTKWFSLARLKSLWPDKADDIAKDFEGIKGACDDPHIQHRDYPDGGTEVAADGVSTTDPDFVDIARKQYRVLECWQRDYTRVSVLVNAGADIYQSAEGWDNKDIAAVMTIPGFTKVGRTVKKIRVTTVAGSVVLADEISELFDEFGLIPVYAKKRGKKVWSKIKGVIDPQREANKRHSQYIDIINKMAAYGYFYDDQTFVDPKDERRFKRDAAKPGFTCKVQNIKNKPVAAEGVKFPGEVVQLMAMESDKIKEIMNVNGEMLGQASNAESGIAIARRQQSGLMGNEFLFDNLSLAKRSLGRLLVKLIQKVYTPHRMARILQTVNQRNVDQPPVQLGGQPIEKYPMELLQALLEEADLTKYDVAVGESQHSPTNRMINFALWSEMAAKGVPVPPELLIDLSDLPDKEKVKQMIAQASQAAAAQESQKYDTEITKAQIAAQSKQQGGGMEPQI